MAAFLGLIRPILPLLLQRESRNGLLLIFTAIIFSMWLVNYVDTRHNEVKQEMTLRDDKIRNQINEVSGEFKHAIKNGNDVILEELRAVRGQMHQVQGNVLQLYRDVIIKQKHP